MSLNWKNMEVGSLRPPQLNFILINATSFHRPWRPPRRKRSKHLVIRSSHQLSSSIYSSYDAFLSQLNSLDLLAPALGFTTAIALLYNSTRTNSSTHLSHGEWTLFTTPTPFNRFVKFRCASLLLEDSNEKLIEEDGHLVSYDTGPIRQTDVNDYTDDVLGKQFCYQRICIKTDDGGVVSLDWPSNLELNHEYGLDTTVLIVPGTTDGSMDENVKSFVYECLKRGCFPIVMNPRGCAHSPLTTPRLFTAADSNDICTTVQFVNRARPWTTLMGVGLGYGANMLTKYLAEVGEETPLTAATCLDNPFDLKQAARSINHLYDNQNLTDGLIDILQSNKELFQGRAKGFDVENALQATSIQDFDEAISMVSYGFDSIEEFYLNSSTRDVVGNVKIPLLFIQDDTMSSFSIPRSLIAENPYTSLLTGTFQSNNQSKSGTFGMSWCQHLVVEWLTAVELGLLKGRHPLLEDTDVTINPSKRLKLSKSSPSSTKSNNLLQLGDSDVNASYPSKKMLKSSSLELQKPKTKDKELKTITNGAATQTLVDPKMATQTLVDSEMETQTLVDPKMATPTLVDSEMETQTLEDSEVVKEEDADLVESERGKMLQATEVVMNMLDVTMPEALSEEKKKKVLTAIGKGETLMTALQGAVPEDVRGKLTSAVTGILQKKKLDGVSSDSHIPDAILALGTKIQEKSELSVPNQEKDPKTSEQKKEDTSLPEVKETVQDSDSSEEQVKEPVKVADEGETKKKEETDTQSSDDQKSIPTPKTEETKKKEETDTQSSDDQKSIPTTKTEETKKKEETDTQSSDDQKSIPTPKTEETKKKEETDTQSSDDQKSIPTPKTEESSPETKDGETQKKEEPAAQPVPEATSSDSSSFSVSHALDAFTGMDDSTQLAVNSVFSVIEDVITQLEGSKDEEPATSDKNNKVEEDTSTESESKNHQIQKKSDLQQNGDTSTESESKNHQIQKKSNLQQKEDTSAESESKNQKIQKKSDLQQKGEASESKNDQIQKKSDLQQKGDTSTESESENHQIQKKSDLKQKGDEKDEICQSITKLPHQKSLHDIYLQSQLLSDKKDDKSHDSDAEADLLLDLVPEEGKWKLSGHQDPTLSSDVEDIDDIIEPAYVILDGEDDWDILAEDKKAEIGNDASSMVLKQRVKENILSSLKVEICRRIQATDMVEMAPKLKKELEQVANDISMAVVHEKKHIISWNSDDLFEPGNPHAEHVLDAITSSIQATKFLKKVIPVGIVVGTSLASLRKVFNIATADEISDHLQPDDEIENSPDKVNQSEDEYEYEEEEEEEEEEDLSLTSDSVMVGAVTAALGASALLVHHQQDSYSDGVENSNQISEQKSESGDDNLVTSLAEKAMLVAGPVMPTNEEGEVDQDKLVAMLANLGQRGGILRLVGKAALLWGGIRGALSLIGKLISFLRLSNRPLYQRILGFASLVLVLWTPVVVPLLPTLVQNWASNSSSKFAELVCVIGLYGSIMVLVLLWGQRIREYEDPLKKYGLLITSKTQIKNYLYGLIGGVAIVSLIQLTNATLGFVSISWSSIPSSTDAVAMVKFSGDILKSGGQGLVTATAIALVEELLFRSWLPEEIAVDLGYHRGIILSGLAFSLSQWSLKSIPGIWLLSLGLSGVRRKSQGSLAVPIGLRAGIMASSFVLKGGGFLIYQPDYNWILSGGDPFQPFNSIVGLVFALLWALTLYPKTGQDHIEK